MTSPWRVRAARRSWLETFDPPRFPALPNVSKPVVQPTRLSLPELEGVRRQSQAPPFLRDRHVGPSVKGLHPFELPLQRLAALDQAALTGCQRADLGVSRASSKISL